MGTNAILECKILSEKCAPYHPFLGADDLVLFEHYPITDVEIIR
jgi:hypothetical protein